MLRIAFAGTPQFALPTLRALAASPHRLVGVLTQPDRPAGRGRAPAASPVKQLAEQLGLPLLQPQQLRGEEVRTQLAAWAPELLVVVAYGLILPAALLQLPRLGGVNVHASLLPRWRGAAPIQHAILAGDAHTGVTLMRMDAGLDTGPVLASRRLAIGATTTAGELENALAHAGAQLLAETLALIEAGSCPAQPQGEQDASYAPKFERQAAQIDWGGSALQIDRQIRAFNPRPVAFTGWRGSPLRIWEGHVAERARTALAVQALPAGATAVPGTVLGLVADSLLVLCGAGEALAITRVQLPGRRPVTAPEFARGRVSAGERLGI
ncbi:MAG TPA: methionyl-tRNA formyltransferase [Steroidobacteraceae bacterium]|nr:methionyl-tRNA formyltransferase [Steroidobacteraceae bacterium]